MKVRGKHFHIESASILRTTNRKNEFNNMGGEVNWLFNVTINDISVIYVTAHRCAGWLKLDLWSGSQRNIHLVGFFNMPVQAPTRGDPFYTVIPRNRPI